MKNLAIATVGLIIVIVLVFLFSSKQKGVNEENSPSPIPSETPTLNSMANLPFSVLTKEEIESKKVRISTAKGDIVFELFGDAPIASSNFIYLTEGKFYDGLTFHRREEGFVIQGGDPKGNGTGDPGYKFSDEPVIRDYTRGIVAMANSGPNTNGSQFFIMLADTSLPKQYTIFGNVTSGMEVVDQIQVGDVMEKVTIE
ncbi:MAG: Peptidyl-prolyl cis-trans isomerase [Candidatus Curtissbacteria bacterium GW2011_GWA1_40_47]|nr:MAG: Peptidyl-prolyl cis-trans isomerase [Candidatus Curtissbacteria bacterium GW2011_GWB1_40_28]KKR62314.1 MAG: peptidyl-prolyl cis-trans isomerase protein, peptidyl-prolyl cis-trans isomerase B (cyclophilin B) [Microgenomates group bacterium GW2011_GWC1_40_35]KKR66316.1 MAG: Peptidyl-prolyl cis-trans isomerase [Candidatus Curtissbacteria bacterium GW2011_GWA1_40_47]KKS02482.1 MAG: Peptidyl-prolyl cis-trans isomerase [Candidatus Curtissbacteria bacterium GW2011_GWC2_41_21]